MKDLIKQIKGLSKEQIIELAQNEDIYIVTNISNIFDELKNHYPNKDKQIEYLTQNEIDEIVTMDLFLNYFEC